MAGSLWEYQRWVVDLLMTEVPEPPGLPKRRWSRSGGLEAVLVRSGEGSPARLDQRHRAQSLAWSTSQTPGLRRDEVVGAVAMGDQSQGQELRQYLGQLLRVRYCLGTGQRRTRHRLCTGGFPL